MVFSNKTKWYQIKYMIVCLNLFTVVFEYCQLKTNNETVTAVCSNILEHHSSGFRSKKKEQIVYNDLIRINCSEFCSTLLT